MKSIELIYWNFPPCGLIWRWPDYFLLPGVEFEIKHNSKIQGSMGRVFQTGVLALGLLSQFLLLIMRCKLMPLKQRYWCLSILFFIKKNIGEPDEKETYTEIIQHYCVKLVHLDFLSLSFPLVLNSFKRITRWQISSLRISNNSKCTNITDHSLFSPH